ncbi:unnamed protein product [Didymodactylos carnosus]|uniref:ISXO2-like transposase domain-containing protein n=1 Tax=Didymodactylos carnosus TaxID=1234261 RepID=A0A816D068_9BILA|nr:unnamed protein product [Didymodactylos carnosus]CAF4526295.1 unnamed protein product [Didymodactylos carnosus]
MCRCSLHYSQINRLTMAVFPLPKVDDMTIREWSTCTDTIENTIQFAQTLGLLPVLPPTPCPNGHDNWYLGKYSRSIDKYQWRCREKNCKLTRSLRDGTFFSNSKLELQQILDLMYYWSQGVDTYDFLQRQCNFGSKSTIADWKNFLRDVCAEHFLRHPAEIGGVGHVVEIDESSWTKRKFNRGRVIKNQWVFGGIDRDTRECFAVLVERRDAATLLPIIQQHVRPGTTILSDEWRAYHSLQNGPGGYIHQTVNHSLHFVDPVTGVHTQNIENMWMCAKQKKKRMMGMHVSLLDTYLMEFMWRRRFPERPLENLIAQIFELYPVLKLE